MECLYVVVMAGGSGERFWPLSTPAHPKQFPPLFEGRSSFQRTVERADALVGRERVLVATRRDLLPLVREFIPGQLSNFYLQGQLLHLPDDFDNNGLSHRSFSHNKGKVLQFENLLPVKGNNNVASH